VGQIPDRSRTKRPRIQRSDDESGHHSHDEGSAKTSTVKLIPERQIEREQRQEM